MRKLISLMAVALMLSFGFLLAGAASANGYVVIVNSENPVSSISRKDVSKMMLGKKSKWENGESVTAFDLPGDNSTRAEFSEAVCKKSVDRVKAYWLRLTFAGRGTAPAEEEDDAAIMAAVAKKKGGISYVAASTELVSVKKVTVTD
jgi:ABC-type phosphate transport system substrate-binding protein